MAQVLSFVIYKDAIIYLQSKMIKYNPNILQSFKIEQEN